MRPHPYPPDLSDEEWSILAPLLVPGRQAGHPRVFEPRRIADAAFYLLRAGCQWRALPHEFPPWPTAYYHYNLYGLLPLRKRPSGWGVLASLRSCIRRLGSDPSARMANPHARASTDGRPTSGRDSSQALRASV